MQLKVQFFFDFASKHNICTVFVDAESIVDDATLSPILAQFVANATLRNIGIQLLFGNPQWTLPENHPYIMNLTMSAVNFINSLPAINPSLLNCDCVCQQPKAEAGYAMHSLHNLWLEIAITLFLVIMNLY